MFEITVGKAAKRFLRKLDQQSARRLIKKIEALAAEPFPSDVKRVSGRKDKVFRVRVGKYRIIYLVYHDKNEVLIADIDKGERVF